MIFASRYQAGVLLAGKLLTEHVSADIIVGLTHGGVVVSSVVARRLHIPGTMLRVKKIGSPENPEYALGAMVLPGQKLPIQGKTVLVTDDGIATGETMKAAVKFLRDSGATKIIVAVPVAPADVTIDADDYIVLEKPSAFGAVGEFYKNFPQLTDKDMVKYLT